MLDADPAEAILRQVEKDPSTDITIDIEKRIVVVPAIGLEATFPLDDFTQYRLLNGLDDIGLTLQHADEIAAYETTRKSWLPTTAGTSRR
jgi:3-isopropylmalate/(R)-2-methylmalate dehydratase small subunit